MRSMQKTYGKKKAKEVFYASRNAGKIKNVDRRRKKWYPTDKTVEGVAPMAWSAASFCLQQAKNKLNWLCFQNKHGPF